MTNAERLHDLLNSVWLDQDFAAAERAFAPRHGASRRRVDGGQSPEDFTSLVRSVLDLVAMPELTILQTVAAQDWVSVLFRLRGDSQVNVAVVTTGGQIMARFEDGRIADLFLAFDLLGLFEQLALIPEGTASRCLSGEPLG